MIIDYRSISGKKLYVMYFLYEKYYQFINFCNKVVKFEPKPEIPNITFGIPVRPSTPIKEVISHQYQDKWIKQKSMERERRIQAIKEAVKIVLISLNFCQYGTLLFSFFFCLERKYVKHQRN